MAFKLNDRIFNADHGSGTIIKILHEASWNPYLVKFDSCDIRVWCKENSLEEANNIPCQIGKYSKDRILKSLNDFKELQKVWKIHNICSACSHYESDNGIDFDGCAVCAINNVAKFKLKE